MDKILQKLDRLEKLILNSESPRVSRREAAKFMKIGEEKFVWLISRGVVNEHYDHFGDRYYMKDELLQILKEPVNVKKVG